VSFLPFKGIIAERELARFGIRPDAPINQFVKRAAMPEMRQWKRDGKTDAFESSRCIDVLAIPPIN